MRATQAEKLLFRKHITNLLLKAGPISAIYISNILLFMVKRYLIAKNGINTLDAHIIARSIAEMCGLPIPLLISQDAVYVSNLFGGSHSDLHRMTVNLTDSDSADDDIEHDANLSESETSQYIGDIIRHGYILSILASVPTAGLLLVIKKPLISLFHSDDAASAAAQYLTVYAFSLPFEYLNYVSDRFLSSVNQEIWIIPYRLVSTALDLGLSFWLIPKYSVQGAAYALLGRNIASFLMLSVLFVAYGPIKKYKIFRFRVGNTANMKNIIFESWPYSLYQVVLSIASYIISAFMGQLGPGRLAVFQIPHQFYMMLSAINSSLNDSANRIISQHYGAKNFIEIQRAGNYSAFVLNTTSFLAGSIVINLLFHSLSSLYLDDSNLKEYSTMLRYNYIIVFFINLFNVYFEAGSKNLAATKDTFFASAVWALTSLLVTVPLSAISVNKTDFDIYGLTGSMAIGSTLAGIFTLGYWIKRSNKIAKFPESEHPRTSNKVIFSSLSRFRLFTCSRNSASISAPNDGDLLLGNAVPMA